ncbi:MAG TPA: Mrp/NBP35 family ATP-binding protein [Candidatus Binatia bacterium]|nr:Mrp/NBP35 family ATP-binding protein [Candidatus Binatia bacterium]
MAEPVSLQAIEQALATVMEPELHRDIVSLQMVRDLRFEDGVVALRLVLTTPACPLKELIERDIRQALIGRVSGVDAVQIAWDSSVTSGARALSGRQDIPGVKNTIAISAGKGGVGKTTISVNVALALARAGARVGLLDADIYGPNVPIMMGITEQPMAGESGKMLPLRAHGIEVVSFGTILKPGQPVMWRGPMLAKAMREFLYEVEWGPLDYMVIDLPPGTGDIQISLAQSIPLTGAVIVTTPQDVSIADVSRGIQMFAQLRLPVLGVVENMSGFICSHCGERTDVFGSGGGRRLAERYALRFLGEIPLDPTVRLGGGDGRPLMASTPDSPAGRVFRGVAEQIAAEVSVENFAAAGGPQMPAGPRIPVRG